MSFEETFPPGAAKINVAKLTETPKPDQHRLVMQWPYFGLEEEMMLLGFPFKDEHGRYLPENDFRPKGLLLVGDSGTGKTTSLWILVKQRCDDGLFNDWIVAFWRAVQLGRAITAAASNRGDEDDLQTPMEALSRKLRRCHLLWIDDLDKARFTPRVQSEIFDVIEARDATLSPNLVTTNCTGKEVAALFTKNLGDPIVNRLARACYCINYNDAGFNYDEQLAAIQADTLLRAQHQAETIRARLGAALCSKTRGRGRTARARGTRKTRRGKQSPC